MVKIIIELTNRCNLSCRHCFAGRHAGREDLPQGILNQVLDEAQGIGVDRLDFTGGEPTLHPQFFEIIRLTHEAGFGFGFNTNGWNFGKIYSDLKPLRGGLGVITFSLDGVTEESHDRLRGKGSFRQVLQSVSICVIEDFPFTINMVITARNRHELKPMMQLATRLGSSGLRFGHLMPTPHTANHAFDLSPWERKVVDAEILHCKKAYPIPIGLAPGHYTTNLFPCAALHLQELNIDCRGNLTKCCHLSGHGNGLRQRDVIGNLGDITLAEAYRHLMIKNEKFQREKISRLSSGAFRDSDFFPCWYCSLYHEKVDWLKEVESHPWGKLIRNVAIDEQGEKLSGADRSNFVNLYRKKAIRVDKRNQSRT